MPKGCTRSRRNDAASVGRISASVVGCEREVDTTQKANFGFGQSAQRLKKSADLSSACLAAVHQSRLLVLRRFACHCGLHPREQLAGSGPEGHLGMVGGADRYVRQPLSGHARFSGGSNQDRLLKSILGRSREWTTILQDKVVLVASRWPFDPFLCKHARAIGPCVWSRSERWQMDKTYDVEADCREPKAEEAFNQGPTICSGDPRRLQPT